MIFLPKQQNQVNSLTYELMEEMIFSCGGPLAWPSLDPSDHCWKLAIAWSAKGRGV
jgi:hypothetical protein